MKKWEKKDYKFMTIIILKIQSAQYKLILVILLALQNLIISSIIKNRALI